MTTEQLQSLYKILDTISKAATMEGLKLTEDEVTEQQLFCLIKARDEIKHLVIDVDPDRFGPIRSYAVTSQEMKVGRLNLCTICGSTRCQSDHK